MLATRTGHVSCFFSSATATASTAGTASSTALDDDANPTFTGLTSTFHATGAPAILDPSVTVTSGTTDGVAAGWNGGSLTVYNDSGYAVDIDTSGSIQVLGGTGNSGSLVIVNGNLVGTIGNDFQDSYGSFNFNSDATDADVQAIVEALKNIEFTGVRGTLTFAKDPGYTFQQWVDVPYVTYQITEIGQPLSQTVLIQGPGQPLAVDKLVRPPK